jgi:c(7)-type cytochrome triheme protein
VFLTGWHGHCFQEMSASGTHVCGVPKIHCDQGDTGMNRHGVILVLIMVLIATGSAHAVGPGKTLEFTGSSQGGVVFDGSTHKNAGLTCSDCHNMEMFPRMKRGTVKITMSEMFAGKYCGRCHNGKDAFMIKDNCTRCHHEPEK